MGTVDTHVSPEIVKVSEDVEDTKNKCSLSWEINNEEDNDGVSEYVIGSSYIARLYKGGDIGTVSVFFTNGSIGSPRKTTGMKTEQITFSGGKESSLSFMFAGFFSYDVIGTAYSDEGTVITPSFRAERGTSVIVANTPCFCVVEVTYRTEFYKYSFSSSINGEGIIGATSRCGGDISKATISVTFGGASSSISSTSSISSSASIVQTTTVTLIYKDFVTGKVLEGVSVSVDGSAKGSTNASGKITISGITTNETHLLKASRAGYLTTDSDSLANDSFVVNT